MRRHEAQQSDLHVRSTKTTVFSLSKQFLPQIIATACMFLAGKVEETPKSLSDLLKVSLTVRHRGEDAVKLLTADAVSEVNRATQAVLIVFRRISYKSRESLCCALRDCCYIRWLLILTSNTLTSTY